MKQYCFLLLALFSVVFLVAQRTTITDKQIVNTSLQIGGGTPITRTLTDGTLTGATNADLATAAAVKTYVDGLTGGLSSTYFPLIGGTLTGTTGNGFLGLPPQGLTPTAPASGIRMFANGASNLAFIRNDGYITTISLAGATGNRFFNLPVDAGTFAVLENTQTWTGVNTFANTVRYQSSYPLLSMDVTGAGDFAEIEFKNNGVAKGYFWYEKTANNFRYGKGTGQSWRVNLDYDQTSVGFQSGLGRSVMAINWPSDRAAAATGVTEVLSLSSGGSDLTAGAESRPMVFKTSGNLLVGTTTDITNAIFQLSSTNKFSINAPTMTDAQAAAITGQTAGGWVYSLTQQRPFVHNGTAFQGVVLGPQAGFPANQIPYGGTAGNLTSVSNFTYNPSTQQLTLPAVTGIRGTSAYTHIFNAGGSDGSVSFGFGQDPTTSANRLVTIRQVVNSSSGITNGTINTFTVNPQYAWASGTASPNVLNISPALNFTGTYVGTVRGIYYNPTVTSTTGLNHVALETTAGNVIFNGGNVSTNGSITVSSSATINGAITATANTHRFGWLMVLTSGTAGATGQAIKITGPDSEFELQGTGGNTLNTFSFANYITKTGMRGMLNTNPINSFIRIYGGFENPNANNLTGAVLAITPQYNVSSGSGQMVKGVYYNPTLTNISSVSTHFAWESTSGDFVVNGGSMLIGATTVNPSAILELNSTSKGFLIPRATDAQIAAVSSPALLLTIGSTTSERINVKRTSGFFQLAYVQDIKRDTAYRTVNANLDLSGLTATFANRYKRVIVETIVTVAATGNNTITMPVPTVDLLGTKFEISVEDTSGDGDISVLNFGTDGTDGYLYNGDGTYSPSQNLYPGIGVYVSVSWCQAKGAYRWKLQ